MKQRIKRKFISYFERVLLKRGYFLIHPLRLLGRKRILDITDRMDYVRMSSLELAAFEIYEKNIPGSIAELGVYQGEFAEKINAVFPDRKFYLFDTYSGFNEKDIHHEKIHGFSTGGQDFSDTSIARVLGRMPNPENCIIKKGYFPETTFGLEDSFVFVSIDVDLYKPIYEGLEYFYPRLTIGGYIFIHDYNNSGYRGVKEAVRHYCDNHKIAYFPMSDGCGSATISK